VKKHRTEINPIKTTKNIAENDEEIEIPEILREKLEDQETQL